MGSLSKRTFLVGAVVLASILLLLSLPGFASLADVAKDLHPVDGYVVKVQENEYIIDLDAQKGVSAGDIIGVFGPAEKLTHPITGKVIGSLDVLKGVLKVTRIRQGFSFARALDNSGVIVAIRLNALED